MRDRIRATLIALLTLAGAFAAPLTVRAATTARVVIIVGPTGSMTSSYRSQGDQIAAAAATAGATVVKVYSPNATWAKVKAAVNGANVIVYLGHGNGYPNPYTSTFYGDRTDGWGLNRTTTNGDGDNWSTTMVYCGEKALTGTLTTSDGSVQRTYCTGGRITPARGFVMVYANACYAPGASEPGTTAATAGQALQRVSYYSRPALATLGASGYFATDHGAAPLVHDLLTSPGTTYGAIYLAHVPSGMTLTDLAHPSVGGARVKLGRRSTDPYYTYAFAGNPSRTFGSAMATDTARPTIAWRSPGPAATGITMSPAVSVRFSEPVWGLTTATMVLRRGATTVASSIAWVPATSSFVLRPSRPLMPAATYSLILTAGIRDHSGNAFTTTSWSFSTAWSETYSPARTLRLAAGMYTGYKFTTSGAVTSTHRVGLSSAGSAATTVHSAIKGQTGAWYWVTTGVMAGYWLKETTGTTLS